MKLMLLGAANSTHIQHWANGLVRAGLDVLCVSQHEPLPSDWDERVEHCRLPVSGGRGYVLNARELRRLMYEKGASLLHAHYASGYGLMATLSGCRPRLVSAWGSDIQEFPERSPLHRMLLRRVLCSADAVACTSLSMTRRVQSLTGGRVQPVVTPFGVDIDRFAPVGEATVPHEDGTLYIGTVKSLASVYGIDLLLRAFAALRCRVADAPTLRLRIVGDGPQRGELYELTSSLGLQDAVEFVGTVPNVRVPAELRSLDVFVVASRHEGFGVAAVEAAACGLPVVASTAGGLPEVVDDGTTGLLVPVEDVDTLTAAIARLIDDAVLRHRLGAAGREMAVQRYGCAACVATMLSLYRRVMAKSRR